MKRCILPFSVDVEMRTFQNKAFPLGAFKANMPDYDIWLCNKLINSLYRANGRIDTYHEGIWSVNDGLTIMQTLKLKTTAYENKGIDIITFNKEMLNEGAYITGRCNEFYIKGKSAYQKYDFNRDYIIFGYDEEAQVFKSAGYLANGSYTYYDIDYDSYFASLMGIKEERLHIEYYQMNKEYEEKLDIKSIKEKLGNYLYSQKDIIGLDVEASCYGIMVWDKLVDYVENRGEKDLSKRFGRFYMEHRLVMAKRFQKLYELGYLIDEKLVEEYFQKVYIPARNIHYLFLKYNLTKNAAIYNGIIDKMKIVNEQEEKTIIKVLENID